MKKTLAEGDPMMLHEHNRAMYLGRTSNGTLRLHDSPLELRYEVDLPDTSAGRDVASLLERGDVKGASFGFDAIPASVRLSRTDSGMALRSVGEARLDHVSTTCAPVYDTSTAELCLRSLAEATHTTLEDVVDATRNGKVAELFDTPDPLEALIGLEGLSAEQIEALAQMTAAEGTVIHRRPSNWFV